MGSVTALALISLLGASALPLPAPPAPASPGQRLASHLVSGLVPSPEYLSATATYRVDVTLHGGPQALGDYVADQLEAALNRSVKGVTRLRSVRESATHRVELDLRLRRARVDAVARLIRSPSSFWERLRAPEGRLISTATASAEMDLELRILAERSSTGVTLKRLRLVNISGPSSEVLSRAPVLDMIQADLDGDALREVVLLQPDRLVTARWRHGGLDVIDEASLEVLPTSASRLRQPMGRLVLITADDGSVALLVASSECATASLWRYGRDRWRLEDAAPASGQWPLYSLGPGRWLTRGSMSSRGALVDEAVSLVEATGEGYDTRPLARATAPFYALRAHGVFRSSTPSWSPYLVMSAPGSRLTVWPADDPEATFELSDVGEASLIIDLDGDGSAELLHTSAALEGTDTLTLRQLGGPRQGRKRWSGRVPDPVTSLASTDLDEDGFHEVLVATWSGGQGGLHILAPLVRQ